MVRIIPCTLASYRVVLPLGSTSSPFVIRQIMSSRNVLHHTAVHRRKSLRSTHCSWHLFGAWPWCLLRQVLGARQAGAGGGPCHHAKSMWLLNDFSVFMSHPCGNLVAGSPHGSTSERDLQTDKTKREERTQEMTSDSRSGTNTVKTSGVTTTYPSGNQVVGLPHA